MNEDQRQAAALKVSISSYVGTATLALIAGAVALFTYVSQNFEPPWTFYLAMGTGVALLVVSFVLGGRGANKTADAVAQGAWDAQFSVWEFNWQAVLTLIGLVVLLVGTTLGTTAKQKGMQKAPANRSQQAVVLVCEPQVNLLTVGRSWSG